MIAIIPARSGSKRLPGKNLKLLNGKPLIAYTIEEALKSKYITKVIVSTDSKEIADIAKGFGAIIPGLRPNFLSTDMATTNDVIAYTMNLLENEFNEIFTECILLQPTSPLRNSTHINDAIELFMEKEAQAVISMTKEHHPISWHKYISEEGILEKTEFSTNKISYYPNGAIYVLSKNTIVTGDYYTSKTYGYIMDRESSCDIDTQDDWDYAHFIIKQRELV